MEHIVVIEDDANIRNLIELMNEKINYKNKNFIL